MNTQQNQFDQKVYKRNFEILQKAMYEYYYSPRELITEITPLTLKDLQSFY